jgi:hypothetical protein
MRILLLILISISFLSSKAQTHLPVSNMNFGQSLLYPGYNSFSDSSHLNQKWYFSKYVAISAGSFFYNGGGGTFLSAPVGLQLNHPLNNNLIAFAGISAAPAFFNLNSTFANPLFYKSYPGSYMSNPYGFGLNSRVEMGLMYINDAKTFSISGSIGVERSSYPVYPTERTNTKKQ